MLKILLPSLAGCMARFLSLPFGPYLLMDVVVMALTAVICGADDFVDIAEFVSTKKEPAT
jgi:hypothetical protein